MDDNDLIDIDTMLWHCGDFGRYQLLLLVLFSVINVLSALHYFGQTFISIVPDHQCVDLNTTSEFPVVNTTLCHKTIFQADGNYTVQPCTAWNYNNSYGFISIVQELNWVCESAWKPAIGQSVFFIGSMIGSLAFGVLADRIGRLHVLVAANMLAFLGNIITIISSNAVIYSLSRFLAGLATDTNFVMMFIIVMEYVRPSMRTFALNICVGVFYCLSCLAVPWIAVLLKNWKALLLFVSVPHLSVLGFYFLVPESAQWLISKGRTDEAIACFERIARINRKTINDKHIASLREFCVQYVNSAVKKNDNLFGLLRTPKLRRKTLILVYKSMVMTLCYDAISRNVNGLDYSPFVIFTATSSMILPACLLILAVQDRLGRKTVASGSLLASGLLSLAAAVIQLLTEPHPGYVLALTVIARLSVTVAYNSGAQYAVELVPTAVRGQGVAAVHVAGFAATFFSAQILYLGILWRPAPELVLSALLVSGAFACLFLPETLGRTLPVTLLDGEHFGEDERPLEFACCRRTPTESTAELSAT